jgi:hypothetical protein
MKAFLLFVFSCMFCLGSLQAAPGDTTMVQTFTFGSPQDSFFKFPDNSKPYRKVLMYYTLKCNPKQSPACGEWDYLTYTYLYRHTGKYDRVVNSIDTTFDSAHNVLHIDTTWGSKERLERFELGRFITPYGVNLSLGNGFTWVYDVSDYISMLHGDSVHLSAGNWQELLDLKFAFIEGTPERIPYKVVNVWSGNYNYGTQTTIEELTGTRKIIIDKDAGEARLKIRVSGHGQQGNDNCAEFCPRTHTIAINGEQRWQQYVWRENCAQNPVYPQGGTWVYSRANWCPGAEVATFNKEITPYITSGKEASFDYSVDPFTWNGQGNVPYYALEVQLVYYSQVIENNNDAALVEVISPSTADMQRRKNPICSRPEIVVSNKGHDSITSILFEYGISGSNLMQYTWNGKIPYQEKQNILLASPIYAGGGFPNFEVHILKVNGQADERTDDNVIYSRVPLTQVMPRDFVINLRTNKTPEQNSYTVSDGDGNVLYSKNGFAANTLYRDTIHLANGCYSFEINDEGQNGLAWWAAAEEGNGYLRITDLNGRIIKSFNADFGSGLQFNFNTSFGLGMDEPPTKSIMGIYPNPAMGRTLVDFQGMDFRIGTLQLMDAGGRVLLTRKVTSAEGNCEVLLPAKGLYLLRLTTEKRVHIGKVVAE